MSSSDALNEEVEALTSIYDSEVLKITNDSTTSGTSAILTIPSVAYTFSLTFPPTYPDEPPQILGTHHVDASARKGEGEPATAILRDVLGRIYTSGAVCLFDLIEEATPLLTKHHESQHGATQDPKDRSATTTPPPPAPTSTDLVEPLSESLLTIHANTAVASSTKPPNWILSDSLVVNKSTFIARCLRITSLSEATESISHLLATNKKVASATHNITAWRIKQRSILHTNADKSATTYPPSSKSKTTSATVAADTQTPEIIIQDSDDDGETAAGGRLLHLLQLMDVWNVVVVVTRWYGGVKLGPDRFRCINTVAREALVNGGFVGDEKEGNQKGGGGKKSRK